MSLRLLRTNPRFRSNPTGFRIKQSMLDWQIIDAAGKPVPGKRFPFKADAEAELARLNQGAVSLPPAIHTRTDVPPADPQYVELAGLGNVYLPRGWVIVEDGEFISGEHDLHSHKNSSVRLSTVKLGHLTWHLRIRHEHTVNWNSIWGNSPAPAATNVWTFALFEATRPGVEFQVGDKLYDYLQFNDRMREVEEQVIKMSWTAGPNSY